MAEEIKKKKVSELPTSTTLPGLYVLGVSSENQSVKVPLQYAVNMAVLDKATKPELQAETIRAKAAEETNATNIEEETVRAKLAEQANADAISGLVGNTYSKTETDAKLAEKANATTVSTLASVVSANSGGIATLQAQLTEEATTRGNKDAELEGMINTNETATASRFADVTTSIADNLTLAKAYADSVASGAMKWQGVVATLNDLPANPTKGDFYTVTAENNSEYAWTGEEWANIGADVDFTQMLQDIAANATNIANEISRATAAEGVNASAIASKADDSAVVHLTGNETAKGVKTFTSSPKISVTQSVSTVITSTSTYVPNGRCVNAFVTGLLADYLTAETAGNTYQVKGDYLTTALAAETYQPKGDYLTTSVAAETYQPIGSYLTEIADGSITTAKLADSAVTAAKLASSAVTSSKIGSNAVLTAKIKDANVTTAKLADGAVTEAKLDSAFVAKVDAKAESTDLTAETARAEAAETALQTAIDTKATDTDVVHLSGDETVAGTKTFSSAPIFGNKYCYFGMTKSGYIRQVGDVVEDSEVTSSKWNRLDFYTLLSANNYARLKFEANINSPSITFFNYVDGVEETIASISPNSSNDSQIKSGSNVLMKGRAIYGYVGMAHGYSYSNGKGICGRDDVSTGLGVLYTSSGNSATDYIAVNADTDYIFSNYTTTDSNVWAGYCWYDSDKVAISGGLYITGAAKRELTPQVITSPSNAAYFRFTYRTDQTTYGRAFFCKLNSSLGRTIYNEVMWKKEIEAKGYITNLSELVSGSIYLEAGKSYVCKDATCNFYLPETASEGDIITIETGQAQSSLRTYDGTWIADIAFKRTTLYYDSSWHMRCVSFDSKSDL